MSERRRTLANTAFSGFGVYAEYLLGLIASILTARVLGPHELGIYSLGVWIVATGVIVANAGISTAAIKFVAELRGGGNESLVPALMQRLRRLQRLTLGVVLAIVAAVFVLAGDRLMPGMEALLLGMLLLSLAMRAPYMLNIALAKGTQDFRATAVIAGIGALANLAMVVTAFAWRAALPAFVAIYLASSAVFLLISQHKAQRILATAPAGPEVLPPEIVTRLRHHLRVVALTIVISTIGASEVELLFLTLLADPADAGHFKVANALATGAALLVPGVVAAQLLPLMANAYGKGAEYAARQIATATAWLLILGAPLVAFGVVFGDHLIEVLYGAAFAVAGPALAVLMLARVATTLGQGASAYLVSADRQTTLMVLTLIWGALRFFGAWITIRYYGLMGAVWSSAVLAILGSGVTIAFALQQTHSGLPWLRFLRILLAAALVALCAWPTTWMRHSLLELVTGAIAFALLYPIAVLALHCMSGGEREYAAGLATRLRAHRVAAWLRKGVAATET